MTTPTSPSIRVRCATALGWTPKKSGDDRLWNNPNDLDNWCYLPTFETSYDSGAVLLVEFMRERELYCAISTDKTKWVATFWNNADELMGSSWGTTLPLAITLAFIAWLDGQEEA